ncbi:MAG: helix-turn-helix domain-containing protein, partial [Bacteroidales bacterium]|nr:helix-turn-helix domain-containing protein [Bacteroidales bacterium]
MFIIYLFLKLFRICTFFISLRYKTFPKIALLWLEVNYCRRYFKEHDIRYPFKPHEKHIIAELFRNTKKPERFFSLVSPKTILSAWKNYLAKYWAGFNKKRKKGRPQVTKAIKNLILKLKQENFLWGTRRIRDELKKLSIKLSHETISKILNRFRKTGDIKPTLSWKRFLGSHWKSLFSCDFFTVDTFGFIR